MRKNAELNPELAALLSAACDETLTDEQHQAIAAILEQDPAARDDFADYFLIHAKLYQAGQVFRSTEASLDKIFGEPDSQPADKVVPRRTTSWLDRASRSPLGPAVVVASLGLVALVLLMAVTPVANFFADGKDNKRDELKPAAAPAIATLTGWHRIDWKEGYRLSARDHRLRAGQRMALNSGIAEITYDTGAKVVLEGPCEFVVGSNREESANTSQQSSTQDSGLRSRASLNNSGFLSAGQAIVRVEEQSAEGFYIDTEIARVVDLGTEFGVIVNNDGSATTHVFEGKVALEPTEDASWQRRELTANQSVRVDVQSIRMVPRDESLVARFENVRQWTSVTPPDVPVGTLAINIDDASGALSKNLPPGYQAYTGEGKGVQIASPLGSNGNVVVTVTSPYFRTCQRGSGYGSVTGLDPSGTPTVGYNALVNSGGLVNMKGEQITVTLDGLTAGNYEIRFFLHCIYRQIDPGNEQGKWVVTGSATASNVPASFGSDAPDQDGTPPKSLADVAQVALPFAIERDDRATFTFTAGTLAASRQLWINGFELTRSETESEN